MKVRDEAWSRLLKPFADHDALRIRLVTVLQSIPSHVLDDFLSDPRFHITTAKGASSGCPTILALPAADGRGSRCVVLKLRLARCHEAYGLYVIAHELAHAFLHNGGWGRFDDREEAADALAASWGFPKPE